MIGLIASLKNGKDKPLSLQFKIMRRKFTKQQQEKIYERDKYCQLCGCYYGLSKPHHIFYGSHLPKGWKKGDDINGEWNGIILCDTSHNGFHHTAEFCNGDSLQNNRAYLEGLAQQRYDRNRN